MKSKAILFAVVLSSVSLPRAKADAFTAFTSLLGSTNSSSLASLSSSETFGLPCQAVDLPTQGFAADTAIASPGVLGDFSQATITAPAGCFNGSVFATKASSSFTLTGITLSGPPGTAGQVVPFTINATISGGFGATGTDPTYGAAITAEADWTCGSSLGGTGGVLGTLSADSGGGLTKTGVFSTNSAQAGQCAGRVGENTISVGLSLQTTAEATLSPTGSVFTQQAGAANGFVDFSRTLEFPTSGPVFNLPAGFTVNSADGAIVNNQFVGFPTVPEPGTLLLLGTSLLTLASRFRRSKSS